jgi:hypothetical protein
MACVGWEDAPRWPHAMTANPYVIHYVFELIGHPGGPAGEPRELVVRLDPETLLEQAPFPTSPPEWAMLEYQKCPNCPLATDASAQCPTAARLIPLTRAFSETESVGRARVRVETPERTFEKEVPVATGISSLLGLQMATSGCPILGRLRPMARFHLPFATNQETVFRAVATYLAAQQAHWQAHEPADWSLDGLRALYREVALVNRAFASRLRSALSKDASLNALVRLDVFTMTVPMALDEGLASYRASLAFWE